MIDERSHRLLNDLEVCADTALGELHGCRERIRQLEDRVAELEAGRMELEAARLELEAARLELEEENRELDEQNRELEEDNARLRERLRSGGPAPAFPGQARRAQGLAALIGHKPRDSAATSIAKTAATGQGDVPGDAAGPGERQAQGGKPEQEGKAEQGGQVTQSSPTAQSEPQRQGEAARRYESPSQDDHDRQAVLPIEQAPSAEALLTEWYRRYPDTFFKGHTRPLKVGIHQDLAAREPWPEKLVRRALAGYVNLPRYLKAVREGAQRIDLAGQPDGSVDAQAAEHAHRKLERLQAERRQRGQAAAPSRGSKGGSKGGREGDTERNRERSRKGKEAKVKRGEENKGKEKESKPAEAGKSPTGHDSQNRGKGEGSPRIGNAGASEPTGHQETPAATATRADPQARMEAKLSALLAKHNGQRQEP